jgi:hypothetical protein
MRKAHPERLMILDNSAYEFYVKGETLDQEKFFEAIVELRPDMYILPDVLMDQHRTICGVEQFIEKYFVRIIQSFTMTKLSSPQPMAVAQGNSAQELFDCMLRYHNMAIRNIAIPFHNSFYKEDYDCPEVHKIRFLFGELNDDMRYAAGRIKFVKQCELMLNKFHYVHLLGSHFPYEKQHYGPIINSIDTGTPVKLGIAGHELGIENEKPDIIIDDFMTTKLSAEQEKLIINNVNKFRRL